ncbi:hypothetical protein GCM10011499_00560 [Pelagibacterium lentulum]|uniref:Uncharacterized protein n=1 Tax=Pelagibacterium lentulum TaxID=2029865 RepID=A0A916R5A6_9HYPH|nr:hypothetical protein GCM10011499_00560 [Pelagibacterium lentulum]
MVQAAFGIGLDGFGGAFRLANAAIDAFVRMDDEHVFAFVEAVDRTDLNAVGIFAFDAIISNDVGHGIGPGRAGSPKGMA